MRRAIVDASVAIKWVIHESHSEEANALRRQGGLVAPELLLVECANVLWKWRRLGGISASESELALDLLHNSNIEFVRSRLVLDEALRLACHMDYAVYDCLYLALAIQQDCPLVTADSRFVDRVEASGIAPGRVHRLAG